VSEKRLAAAGRHNHDSVIAVYNPFDDFLLARPELVVAVYFFEELVRVVGGNHAERENG
jgi:hypothetical protein